MYTYQAPTLTKLHEEMCESLVTASLDQVDMVTTVDVQRHGIIASTNSMDWDFDLKSMWLTKSRWTMMCRQYLDPGELEAWIEAVPSKIGLDGRGTAVIRTKIVKPRGGAATGHTNRESRRWGSCMLTISYKALPTPTISLHSRTSYLGYIGALDLSVAWMVARYLANEMDVDVSTFKFVWYNESIQWHNFKSLAFLLSNPNVEMRTFYRRLLIKPLSKLGDTEQDHIRNSPALRLSRKWLRKVMQEDADGLTYGDMTYNTYRRIRRRWHAEVLGVEKAKSFAGWSYDNEGEPKEFFKHYDPLPSIPINTLDFRCLGLPLEITE